MVGINSAQLIDCELWGFSTGRIWVECQCEEGGRAGERVVRSIVVIIVQSFGARFRLADPCHCPFLQPSQSFLPVPSQWFGWT